MQTTTRRSTKLFSWLLTLAMILSLLPLSALAAEEEESSGNAEGIYVLMNIPYADFYAAEVDQDESLLAEADAISSATKNKPLNSGLAAGSYHVNSDGSDITGTIYPVYVADAGILEGCKEVDSENDLFCNDSYAYCELTEVPDSYKVLTVEDGVKSFGKATGTVDPVTGVTATLSTEDHHIPYAITLNGLTIASDANVSGIVVRTTDGQVCGLRHLFEIWQKTHIGFYVDETNNFGNGNNDYADLVGKTIQSVTYYLSNGQILFANGINLTIPPLANVTATVTSVDAGATSTSFTLSGDLPNDFSPEYTVDLEGATVDADNKTISLPADADFGSYKLTITDENGKYAPVTASFSLYGYVLMNIPYSEFYAAEKGKDDTVASVDAISSATKSKPLSTLAAGSYHVSEDGSDITGVIYPVQISDASVLTGYTKVTDEDSVTYTVNMRGQQVTTTYEGKDALFGKPSYSYYVLDEKPDSYKTMMVRRGQTSFSAATATAQELTGAAAEVSTNDRHVDVAINVTQAEDNAAITADNVSGVTLHTTDGNVYGLRHVYEIWRGTSLGFSLTGDNAYAALNGKTIDKITYYLNDGTIWYLDAHLVLPELTINDITVDGVDYEKVASEAINFENISLTDKTMFPDGAEDAYLVTIGEETQLLGDTTLKRWVGTWESWQPWTATEEETAAAMLARYPLMDDVWEQAYEGYISAFEVAGMGEYIKQNYPNVDALKAYWNSMTDTKGVASIQVTEEKDGSYQLSWLDKDGKVLAADSYTMTGKVLNGLEGAKMYVFTADTLADGSQYKYFVTMAPDMEGEEETPIAAHYHVQFGSDLSVILVNGEFHNAVDTNEAGKKVSDMKDTKWYATMINADASDLAKYNVVLGMHRAEKFSTADDVLPGIAGEDGTTYVPLFDCILSKEYNQYWHDYCAAVAGDNASLAAVVEGLRTACTGTLYGQAAIDAETSQFCCDFISGAETITVNGNTITVKNDKDEVISQHLYTYQGPVTVGDDGMSFTGYLYMTTDNDAGEFKYFIFREDTPDTTYHIEFRYGSDLDALKGYITGDYAYWLAAGIPENADEVMIENCIALFCVENQDYTAERSAESLAQISDFVGTWDYSTDNGTTVSPDTLYFTVDWSGSGSSSGSSVSYGVSVASGVQNGSVSVSPKNAAKGDTVTITVKPDDGYVLDQLTVTDKNGAAMQLSKKSDTQYTFVMPDSQVEVQADFVKQAVPSSGISFTDVPAGAYYYDAVVWAVENNITTGTSADKFSPNSTCTRAQMVTFLWRAAGSPAPQGSNNPFQDVDAGAYYYDAVQWAVEQGITQGTSATAFSPDAAVTRSQTVTFLWRAEDSPASSGEAPFQDVSGSDYYAGAVQWASDQGITTGTSATTFSPQADCTRAQIVTFLWRSAQ